MTSDPSNRLFATSTSLSSDSLSVNTESANSSLWGRIVHIVAQAENYISNRLQRIKTVLAAIFQRFASCSAREGSNALSLNQHLVVFTDQLKGMSNKDFYAFTSQSFMSPEVADEALKMCPDIRQHANVINLTPEEQNICLQEYIARRLEYKRQNTHRGLTEAKNRFMLAQDLFIKDFTDFLLNFFHSDFYSFLAKRAVDLSRGDPTSERPLGEVQLSSSIRSANQSMLNNLLRQSDQAYKPVGGYIEYLNDYTLPDGALTYEQWRCTLTA